MSSINHENVDTYIEVLQALKDNALQIQVDGRWKDCQPCISITELYVKQFRRRPPERRWSEWRNEYADPECRGIWFNDRTRCDDVADNRPRVAILRRDMLQIGQGKPQVESIEVEASWSP